MSEEANPYKAWLGIETLSDGLDHYRLLGLSRFESSRERIETAGELQSNRVRPHVIGPHTRLAKRLLAEISSAVEFLSDADAKREYDNNLRSRERRLLLADEPCEPTPPRASPKAAEASLPDLPAPALPPDLPLLERDTFEELLAHAPVAKPVAVPLQRSRASSSNNNFANRILLIAGGSVALCIVLGALVWILTGSDDDGEVVAGVNTTRSTEEVTPVPTTNDSSDSVQDSGTSNPQGIRPPAPTPQETPKREATSKQPPATETGSDSSGPDKPKEADSRPAPLTPTPPASANPQDSSKPDPGVPAKPQPAPFQGLPNHVDLPGITSAATVAKVSVGPLSLSEPEKLELALLGAVDLYPQEDWTLRPQHVGSARRWAGQYKKITKSKSSLAPPEAPPLDVVELRVLDDQLWIEWKSNAASVGVADHIRNLVLELRYGVLVHHLRLRSPTIAPTLVLDLSKPSQTLSLSPNAWDPDLRLLQLHITRAAGLPPDVVAAAPLVIQSTSPQRIVLRQEPPQVVLQFSLDRLGKVTRLEIEAMVVEPSGTVSIPFTVDRLATMARTLPGEIVRSKRDLDRQAADARSYDSQIRVLSSRSASNPAERGVIDAQIGSLQDKLAKCISRGSSLTQLIPILERRLKILPSLITLSETLHEQVELDLRTFHVAAGHEVDIFIAATPSP